MSSQRSAMADRRRRWRSLLIELGRADYGVLLLKNVNSALHGTGDVDALAPRSRMPLVVHASVRWCRANGGDAIVCHHVPDGPHICLVFAEHSHAFVLDVKWRRTLFGSTLITADDALGLTVTGELGLPQLTAGAEAVVKAYLYGFDRHATLNHRRLAGRDIAEGLRADPKGAERAVAALQLPGQLTRQLAQAVQKGSQAPLLVTMVKAACISKALIEPGTGTSRATYKLVMRRRCPVMRVVKFERRRIPSDRAGWLAAGRAVHGSVDE